MGCGGVDGELGLFERKVDNECMDCNGLCVDQEVDENYDDQPHEEVFHHNF